MIVTDKALTAFRQEVVKIISSKNKKINDLEQRVERLEMFLTRQGEIWKEVLDQQLEQVPPVDEIEEE